ncbi:NAD(P)/FAD-dependent oxidoreductase [Streptomyces sedi]|uniref:NAD(P)/FAD-dependent oxidoreductase n=1 Tax=Streptomyces sedi TaxID=555059 RepID=A0A5C4USC7_9ACTN|nr:NAD(P)/FAD-dependent oxidoreductase [Streptomyces sedi]TNM26511.1 NAD(P)/FAD-dependent oxidoreductase [Streptomyces sedi]
MTVTERTPPPGDRAEAAYDVAVIGGGPAGLSGALVLARSRRGVLVIDAGEPRNAPSAHAHNYLTRDGAPPAEILAAGRREVRGYGAEILSPVSVVAAESLGDGSGAPLFRLGLSDGRSVTARRLLVATGVRDELPDVPGLAAHWGASVLHCPYCHGWEARDQPIALLASNGLAAHMGLLWSQWSDDVTLVTHTAPASALDDAKRARLAAAGVRVVDDRADGVAVDADGALSGLTLAGGGSVPCLAVVVSPRSTVRLGPLAALGLEPAEVVMEGDVLGTQIETDPTGRSPVPGIWVAGNAASPHEHVVGSAAAGVRAGAMINMDLIEADTPSVPTPSRRSSR